MSGTETRFGEEDCYILFPSHTDGWRLYELVKERKLSGRIAPTPRGARACCGVSLLIDCEDEEEIIYLAQEEGVSIEGTVRLPCRRNARRDKFC